MPKREKSSGRSISSMFATDPLAPESAADAAASTTSDIGITNPDYVDIGTYIDRSAALYHEGKIWAALDVVMQGLMIDPDNADLLNHHGVFAARLGDAAAAEAAYRGGGDWLTELLAYLRGNRDLVERFVAESLPGVAMTHVEATYLAWLDVRGLEHADAAQACLEAGVALSPGAAFGDPGFLRLNFACPRSTLQEALRRLQAALG